MSFENFLEKIKIFESLFRFSFSSCGYIISEEIKNYFRYFT